MEAKYINLTGHEVHELRSDLVIPVDSTLAPLRAKTDSQIIRVVDGIPHEEVVISLSSELPEPQDNTFYIVSQLTLNAIPTHRKDIIAPKQVVRWTNGPNKGQVKGCIGFRIKEGK